ncbi:alpha/beta hydrolase [Mangrovitalea sediminis]|uniref:alpha/beta hydrolase n=1 Tax=Mangrovitalea sediminis TaxID=1982043 RepID=UPI000BE51D69|nr:alpha/beta hydrolase [Mangrovitalea sediminis]
MERLLRALTRFGVKPMLSPRIPVWLQRQTGTLSALILRTPRHVTMALRHLGGNKALAITPTRHAPGIGMLFLHGGAYVMGGFGSHRKLAGWLAQTTQARTWLLDYRLAPEHPCPAALDDALAAYRELLDEGQDPARLIIAGDSAGGGLTLATAVAIREAGLPLPAALVLLSPWVDLSQSGATITTHVARDAMLSPAWLNFGAAAYAGNRSPKDAICSPLNADLTGLPPMLIQVGSEEILLDDARRLNAGAIAAGVDADLQEYVGGGHVFQFHAGQLPVADRALGDIARFVQRRIDTPTERDTSH